MTRRTWGSPDGRPISYHITVAEDSGNGNAFKRGTPGSAYPLKLLTGATISDFLLWNAVDQAYNIAATSLTTDSNGYPPAFQGPDGVEWVVTPDGSAIQASDADGGMSVPEGATEGQFLKVGPGGAVVAATVTPGGGVTTYAEVEALADYPASIAAGENNTAARAAINAQQAATGSLSYIVTFVPAAQNTARPQPPVGARLAWIYPTQPTNLNLAAGDLWWKPVA